MYKTASPYVEELLKGQINWMPFTKKTLETAIKEDKIIFIHIGDIARITEREAAYQLFRTPEVIERINTHFIPIALDTEDVPEALLIGLDMLIITEQSFSIPINIFSLPGIKPFTSFSSTDAANFMAVTDNIIYSFANKKGLLEKSSMYMIERLVNTGIVRYKEPQKDISAKLLHTYVRSWEQKINDAEEYKRGIPYKMSSRSFVFLMKYYIRYNMPDKLLDLKNNIDKVFFSCMFDPVEGGFFSKAEDYSLKAPMFEKSFSENVQAAVMFSFAYKYFGEKKYRIATQRVLNFIENEMKSPQGGYITCITLNKQINDSTYYRYSLKELKEAFPYRYIKIAQCLGMKVPANENIQQNISNTPNHWMITHEELKTLKAIRLKKKERLCDNRVITGYNCMYAAVLCIISRNMDNNQEYISRAEEIISDIRNKQKKGELLLYRYMLSRDEAYMSSDLFDYAMFLNAVILLYKYTQKEEYYTLIRQYTAYILLNFYQHQNGMFSKATKSDQITPLKRESVIDYIRFSANSIMARNMLLLFRLTGEQLYKNIFMQQLYNVEDHILGSGPLMVGWTLQILNYLTDKQTNKKNAPAS